MIFIFAYGQAFFINPLRFGVLSINKMRCSLLYLETLFRYVNFKNNINENEIEQKKTLIKKTFADCFDIYNTCVCQYIVHVLIQVRSVCNCKNNSLKNECKNVAFGFFLSFCLQVYNIYNGLIRDVYHFNKPLNFTNSLFKQVNLTVA